MKDNSKKHNKTVCITGGGGGIGRAIAIEMNKEGYNVAIISCFSDPGLEACREKVNIPVIGSGENAMLLSAQLGNKFSILSPLKNNSFSFNKYSVIKLFYKKIL